MLKKTSRRLPPAATLAMWTVTFSSFWRADTAVAGNSVIASTSPVVSAVTRASALEIVWKMTPSMFGGVFQCSVLAASSTNSPWLASTRLNGPEPIISAFSNATGSSSASQMCIGRT